MLRLFVRRATKSIVFGNAPKYVSTVDHVVNSPFSNVDIPNMPLHEYLLEGVDKWHDKVAAECAETRRKITFSEAEKFSRSFAGFVQKLGLGKGDVAAIVLPNIPEYIVICLGLLRAGLAVTTVNPIYTTEEIKKQLISSGAKMVVTVSQLYPTVFSALDNTRNSKTPVITIKHKKEDVTPSGCINFTEICSSNYKLTDPNCESDNIALIPYSSGTTGLPKGVCLSHRNLVANITQMRHPDVKVNKETQSNHQDVVPVIMPMFHMYGLGPIGINMFVEGVKTITLPVFTTKSFIDILYKEKPSILHVVPPIVHLMLSNPDINLDKVDSIETIISAAAPLGVTDINRFLQKYNMKINFMQMYGMTELGPVSATQTHKRKNTVKIGGSGVTLSNSQHKIVKIDDPSYKALGPNEIGELFCRGPQVMQGYLDNKEATDAVLLPDGWLRTGDIGYYDQDEQLYITDRIKELIKVKGFQVAPAELEEIIREHPHIDDAAVIGVPDARSGEVPKAFVVVKPGSKTTSEDVKKFVASKVVKYKQLTGGVVFLSSIPKTGSGKILRRLLKNGEY